MRVHELRKGYPVAAHGRALLAALVLAAGLLAAGALPVGAQQEQPSGEAGDGATIEMNFVDVEIASFLTIMSKTFDIPFIWDRQEVTGRISLQSPQKFDKEDAYALFETVLSMYGYTTLRPEGSPVVQVVPLEGAQRLAVPIDPEAAPGARNVYVTRIRRLRFAEPEAVKNALAPLISETAAVATYAPANALIVSDTEENHRRYERLIAAMDVEPGDVEFEIVPLQYAAASDLAPLLSQVVDQAPSAPQARGRAQQQAAGGRGTVILADDRTNVLIISADAATMGALRRLIEALDVPGDFEDAGFKIYRLKHAQADELARILIQVQTATVQGGGRGGSRSARISAARRRAQARARAQQQQQQQTAAASEDAPVVITADAPTNSLIVFGPADVIEMVDRLVEALDVPGRAPEMDFKLFALEHADANEVATILDQFKRAPVLIEEPEGGEGGRTPQEGEPEVVIAVDPPTNTLIIFAPPGIMGTFERLVASLDVEGRAPATGFRIYQLQYALADEMAAIFEAFKETPARGAPAEGGERRERPGTPSPTTPETVIAVDAPTNTLIVFAPQNIIATFDRLVEVLDVEGRSEPSTFKVYRLEHASAEELAKVLTEVKESAAEAGEEGSAPTEGPGRTGSGRVQGITISADTGTNSLIVFGTPENIRTMDRIIAQLDVRRPQVYVEALIMEMTLEKSLQLGINWQGSARVGDSVVGGGFPNAQPQTLPEALGQGQGAALGIIGDQIEFQGQQFTSFSAFIQATRQDLDLNILANPQILTLDNEEAEINVSQVIPVSSRVVRDANFQSTTEFEFKDVGVILSITPQITGQDKVLLTIKQESSSVATQQLVQAEDQTAITTLKRSINSKVLIDDRATMAIGGLIQDNAIETETKVPCLGDVPVLGWFFKSRTEEIRKTNLIVFLRPHIVNTQEDLERISGGVRERYDAANQVGSDVEALLREGMELPNRPQPPPE